MRALSHGNGNDEAVPRPEHSPGRTNELALLLTASVALLACVPVVLMLGLGLAAAGKLGATALMLGLGAITVPSAVVCYFWMRRLTRIRAGKGATPTTGAVHDRTTTRIELGNVPPTVSIASRHDGSTREAADGRTEEVRDDDDTMRFPDS
jgi:hypothetical protein